MRDAISGVTVRRARAEDLDACARVFRDTLAATFPGEPEDTRTRDAYLQSTKGEEQWVAIVGDNIIALLSIYWPTNFVHSLFVLPAFQRCGAGRALLAAIRSHAKGDLELKVDSSNAPALSFYRHLGWREVGEGAGPEGGWLRLRWTGGTL